MLVTRQLRMQKGGLYISGNSLLAYWTPLLCGLMTWVGLTALAISFDNWWVLGGGVGLTLFTQGLLGDFFGE